jgi:holo-[acyl-carrier protein] synthase
VIHAIGIDAVEVSRIERAMRRPGFVRRVLTPAERTYCRSPLQVAGRWAAKEAIAKCLPPLRSWHDVEIVPGPDGAPVVRGEAALSGRLRVSITHTRGLAMAVAVLESD